jgi:HEAT repeat protein/VWA domain-containing protein
VASKTAPPEMRVVYVEALGQLAGSPAAHATLLELLKDKDSFVRGMAAAGLGEHRSMDALDPLMAILDDKAWLVQSAALASLPRLTDRAEVRKRVPKLVEFLENVSGRLKVDCAECLHRITGKTFGRDAAAWRKWVDEGMADAAPKPEPTDEGPPAPKPAYGNQDEAPHFYGMPVLSNRVVLILDISLSMYDPIDIDKDRLRRETSRRKAAVTGEKKDDKDKDKDKAPEEDQGYDIPWWKVKTRLDLAKYQTINLVSQLRDDQSFEIITFSKEVTHWMGKIVPATSANKQKAIAMLETVTPEDATNTWGAIAAAFDMVDVNRKGEGLGPDEVYLVTDGAPSLGDIVDSNQILEATLQLCKVKPLRINVIGIGVDLSFLRRMARETGGQSKFFK